MKKIIITICAIFMLLINIEVEAKEINREKFEIVKLEDSLDLLIYTPESYYDENNFYEYPLIVYMHGAGERGNNQEKLMDVSLPKYINEGLLSPECIIVIPQCPSGNSWYYLNEELDIMMDYVLDRFRINSDNISITGHSLGANGSLYYAMHKEGLFNKIAPLSIGNISSEMDLSKIGDAEIKLYHGSSDVTSSNHYKYSSELSEKLIKLNYEPEVTIVSGKGHALTSIYLDNNYGIIKWLMQQNTKEASDIISDASLYLKFKIINNNIQSIFIVFI